jgi:cytochrome c biogenesis protein CcdA
MIHTDLRRRGLPAALLATVAGAVALMAYVALALARLGGPALAVGHTLGMLCDLAGPPLPYLGAAMLPAALAVMAPCLLQLSLVLVAATAGLSATSGRDLLPAGLAFAGGFLGAYGLAALAVGLLGWALVGWGFLLRAAGGLLILTLGLAVLRVLPGGALSGCRGPRWLIHTGRASLRRPAGAGVAFAIYCLGCCGPYLAGLALLGAGAGSPIGGAAIVMAFALLMGVLLLLPMLALQRSRSLGLALRQRAASLSLISGSALVALGAALALEPIVVWAIAR